ncbi:trans-aconitate 2-methyltransferase [Agrobacterium rosae]|uniref:Trans-aconitate 2-methyltransferase n=1 Tax=Agrobacterium rosae TaxID=1972867 RepID=A0AAE5RXN5_9HYPH|nr:trans-aconitate 2-methyltransferase [Agrobacterium rosae]KAA3514320.1 trans-aconitate 2-methyltransferase [Agrobacterium rosae]KAA3522986.1 trans-aconitate 2-methyltransferase [Agrobacterium rosae]MCM2433714.1 trans-aconitate 2-methyltransferase [Agrobacterium rosae]MDX8329728.1 trans-aconitate 2-methyltransferase [Agrobacterium rosae]MQB47690.1 trans-aconitate 2-methyltransferase [Agrobacterium rosae]
MAWSAQQYLKFENERTRPASDLLAQVPLERLTAGYDLGCGPANSTELLAERYGVNVITGVDSDADMLEKARLRLPNTEFQKADLATWKPKQKADLFYANAVFQWLPNHLDILVSLMDHLKPGGVLAVQMPDNLGEPTHLAMEETGAAGPWKAAFEGNRLRRKPLPSPSTYFERLSAKSARVDIWHTIYNHPMRNAEAIVEWVKGTGLRPYLEAAGEENRAAFLADYLKRIDAAYPPAADRQRLLRFPRLFIVAVKK